MTNSHIDIARQIRRVTNPSASVHGPWQWGTVASINTNGTLDVYLDNNASGVNPTITNGIAMLGSYYPTVGDAVLIGRMQGSSRSQRVVLGKLGFGDFGALLWTRTASSGATVTNSGTYINTNFLGITAPFGMELSIDITVNVLMGITSTAFQIAQVQISVDSSYVGDSYLTTCTTNTGNSFAYYNLDAKALVSVTAGAHDIGLKVTNGGAGPGLTVEDITIRVIGGFAG